MLKATPDTNILISGIVFRQGHPADLIRLGTTGQVDLTVSPAILDELADVLARKFHATPDEIAEAREITMSAARVIITKVKLSVVKQDPDDKTRTTVSQWLADVGKFFAQARKNYHHSRITRGEPHETTNLPPSPNSSNHAAPLKLRHDG